jgi:uncharacterized protein YjeT (DUF2065 family)
MSIWLRLAWSALVLVFMALSFFGVFPKDWEGAVKGFGTLDEFILVNAKYPGLFALAVGLLIGSVIVPELWRVVRRHLPRGTLFEIKILLLWSYPARSRTVDADDYPGSG